MNDEIFHELLESIKDVVKEIKDSQKEMQGDIALIKEDLKVHIYRTDLLEAAQKRHEEKSDEKFDEINKDFKPIYKHINYVKGGVALLGIILTVVTVLSLLHKI